MPFLRNRKAAGSLHWLALAVAFATPIRVVAAIPAAEPSVAVTSRPAAARLLRNFDEIWALPEAEQSTWHPVRLEYTVYYYDPLWMALWGRCGDADSYLSLGSTRFPIKPGQRILVEGSIQPSHGMRIADAKVTVLAENVPTEVLATGGKVGRSDLFNKRLVTLEGYVDRQVSRDANHVELYVVAEGQRVIVQVLLGNEGFTPKLVGSKLRAKGVYFARAETGSERSTIELWVQQPDDLEILGTLDRDPAFTLPLLPLARLEEAAAGQVVHVAGTAGAVDSGRSITLQEGAASLLVETPQALAARPGDHIEAVGIPMRAGGRWVLRQTVARTSEELFTSLAEVWQLPESARQKRFRVRLDMLVYYFDPAWKALWGRCGGSDEYLSLGSKTFPIKSGQQILIEGTLVPANGMVVDDARVTIVHDSVPLEPVSTTGRIADADFLNKRFVVAEGYVDRQQLIDPQHVRMHLIIEGRGVLAQVRVAKAVDAPNWVDALLRVKGVYSATQDPTGPMPTLELWIPDLSSIEVLGTLGKDPRFERPATPIESLGAIAQGTLVRIAGTVRGQQPGRLLYLRDETGQVAVHTVQARTLQPGDSVEAIGFLAHEGTETHLAAAVVRKAQKISAPSGTGLPRLRLADQLRELEPDQAEKGYPVQLSGIVTWARPNADFFYVHDSSGGVCVYRPPEPVGSVFVGTKVEVTGVSAAGKFTPVVLASAVKPSASIELPEPQPVTLEQALTGIEEAQWVSMSGYVRGVAADGPWTRADLTTSAGEFSAMLPPSDRWSTLPGAVIRVRGVCAAIANEKRQLTGIRVWVPSHRFVEIEDPAPVDPFTTPGRTIASLSQFSSMEALNRRVKITGVVVHQTPGRLVHIQEGTEALLVLSRDETPLAPGDRIEAVGFPGRVNSRVVLREAVYRRLGTEAEPAPTRVARISPITVDLDGQLVRVEGTLLNVGTQEGGWRLIVQQKQTLFEAVLDTNDGPPVGTWVPHSEVALTGVYEILFDEYRRPHAMRLQLRRPADVEVLRQPPWWTVRRVLGVTAVFAVAAALGFGWVLALRRRVQQQTGVIREQEESERAARLEAALARASKLESLGVMAGGIAHDFNNLLTVVMGNLSLARLDPKLAADTVQCLAESERAANRARDLTQQLLTFAKGGEPIKTAASLPEIVQEAAQFALHGSKVRCEFDFAPNLWPAHVDRGQIGQVVHNLIINANQAMPAGGVARIDLRNDEVTAGRPGLAAGRYVRLSVADAGHGIAPENLSRIFEPYFTTKLQGNGLGLATVYSIVKKHQGHIEVRSTPGQGSTFDVWLPAAASAPVTAPPVAAAPETAATRALLMDDEPSIRSLGTAVLRRMGVDVTAVGDGAAAVAEYAGARGSGRPYQLVILDLTVPGGMGGAEAMEKLRALDPNVRAIVSSGYSKDPVMARYRDYGFCARVPKPYQASDLIEAIRSALES